MLCLVISCQNKQYDSQSYKIEASTDYFSSLKLLEECLTFMNYCDLNKIADIKHFASDRHRNGGLKSVID